MYFMDLVRDAKTISVYWLAFAATHINCRLKLVLAQYIVSCTAVKHVDVLKCIPCMTHTRLKKLQSFYTRPTSMTANATRRNM